MFTDPKRRRKFGAIMLILGIVCALGIYAVKEANSPVYVSSSLGSGYMTDGWGDAEVMFDVLLVLSIVEAVIGALMVLLPVEKDKSIEEDEE